MASSESRVREEAETCPQCGSSKQVRDYQQGTLICRNCGYILLKDIVDTGPEWRAFSGEQREERERGGAPITYTIHDKGLSTLIDWHDYDGQGKVLTPSRRARAYRLRRWQRKTRVFDAVEQSLAFALTEINRMASQLGVPRNVREEASIIYRHVVEKHLTRGRSIEGVASATLYIACRELGGPRTLKEIEEISHVDKKEIGRCHRFIVREFDIHLPPVDPINYVARFCSELNLSGETRTTAIELLQKAKEKRLTPGRNPVGLTASAIYLAGVMNGEHRTQRDVAEVVHVTEGAVRNRYREMVDELDLDAEL